jgi:hypothetical protein
MDVQLRKDELCRKSMLLEISTLLPNPERYIVAGSSSVCDADRFGIGAFRQDEHGNDCQSYSIEAKHRVSTMMKVIVHQNECVELYSVDCLMRSNTQRGTLSKVRILTPSSPPTTRSTLTRFFLLLSDCLLSDGISALVGVDDFTARSEPDALVLLNMGESPLQIFDAQRLPDDQG